MNIEIVERFCTPKQYPETETDKKLLEGYVVEEFAFEGTKLKGYSWGTGRNILLIHGWGSRASHMAFIGRNLAKNGFHVMAFDGPAHGNSSKADGKNTSNMFEFCRAIKSAADKLHPLYAVIGHSMGATAAAFNAAGHERLSEYKIMPERLVLISPLSGVLRMAQHFCRYNGFSDRIEELIKGLENEFEFSMENYYLSDVIGKIGSRILIIHDEDDEEIPVSDALDLKEASAGVEFMMTKGSGHQRILINRDVLRKLKEFLNEEYL